MSRSPLADAEKAKIWTKIEDSIGEMRKHSSRRPDWRITIDRQRSIFVTFSDEDDNGNYFYDLKQRDIESWLTYPHSFVIFVIADNTQSLIFPVSTIRDQIVENKRTTDMQGNFKLHIIPRRHSFEFQEFPTFDTKPFLNNYSLFGTGTPQLAEIEKDLEALDDEEILPEGRKGQRLTNYYERKPKLRLAAILAHGTKCMACGFDFEKAYGERGRGFIEVHHIVPVSRLIQETKINPRTDMVVLCSNCHRMVHRRKNVLLSLHELKSILKK
jgi:hypothetical protein